MSLFLFKIYQYSFLQATFLKPQEIFPVPFRWIYYIAKAVYKSKGLKHRQTRDHLKYYNLLHKLVREHRERESLSDRQSNDLRGDIFNELKMMKT